MLGHWQHCGRNGGRTRSRQTRLQQRKPGCASTVRTQKYTTLHCAPLRRILFLGIDNEAADYYKKNTTRLDNAQAAKQDTLTPQPLASDSFPPCVRQVPCVPENPPTARSFIPISSASKNPTSIALKPPAPRPATGHGTDSPTTVVVPSSF